MGDARTITSSEAAEKVGCASLTLDEAEKRRQLNRILSSLPFRNSLRLRSFLNFVVETTLAGHSESIKAYTIAVEALGRNPSFDPETDPIVRVEAVRLRQALTRYYVQAGRDDQIVIALPRGTYVPVFEQRRPRAAGATNGHAWPVAVPISMGGALNSNRSGLLKSANSFRAKSRAKF